MLASVSQSAKLSRSRVMVPNIRSSLSPSASWPVGSGTIRQAVILFLWTSKPAHRRNTTSIAYLLTRRGLAGYPERERLPCVLGFPGEAGDSGWCQQVSRSSCVTGSGHQSEHDLTTNPVERILTYCPGTEYRRPLFMGGGAPGGMAVVSPFSSEAIWGMLSRCDVGA